MNCIDAEDSAADWLIEYPFVLSLFEELGIDYCCGGRSLQSACERAGVELPYFLQRMAALQSRHAAALEAAAAAAPSLTTAPSARGRPLSYWLEHHPPGYLSRYPATDVRPLALATEIHAQGVAVAAWLRLPLSQQWDSFALQTLSAHLFGRFRFVNEHGTVVEVALLELKWPAGSESIRVCLQALQQLLAPPLAVFRAVRAPLEPQGFPTPEELQLAEAALQAAHGALCHYLDTLGEALQKHAPPARRA